MESAQTEIDLKFDEFFKTVDLEAISKLKNQPMGALHIERMKQSFIKNNGYPSIVDIWPEKFKPNVT